MEQKRREAAEARSQKMPGARARAAAGTLSELPTMDAEEKARGATQARAVIRALETQAPQPA